MEIPDLSFQLDINYTGDVAQLMHYLKVDWDDLGINWHKTASHGTTADNYVEFSRNHSRNPAKIEEENGWFYYPYYILVTSKLNLLANSDTSLKNQVAFCRKLIQHLESVGCTVKAHTHFDDML